MRTVEQRLATIEALLHILPDGTRKQMMEKGKYAGKLTQEQVLEKDPDYIVWLHEKKLAAGFGLSGPQIRAAYKACQVDIDDADGPSDIPF